MIDHRFTMTLQGAGGGQVECMPIPRCDGCKWWEHPSNNTDPGFGQCLKEDTGDAPQLISSIYGEGVQTTPDFGCVQWEAKEEQ